MNPGKITKTQASRFLLKHQGLYPPTNVRWESGYHGLFFTDGLYPV